MNLKNILTDDDAVSPVIGVILMVAITVILAAVIGAFVLGIGSNQEAAPQVTFADEYNPSGGNGFETSATLDATDKLTIKHDGGGSLDSSLLTMTIQRPSSAAITVNDLTTTGTYVTSEWANPASAGQSVTLTEDATGDFQSGQSWTLTWTASSGDSSQILSEGQFP